MLAFLKSIFGGRTASPQGNAGLAIPRTVYTPPPRHAAAHRPAQTPRATSKPSAAAAEPPVPAPVADSNALGSEVDIPLQSVLNGLPPDLKDRVRDLDIRGATMTISLERILAQLSSGSVKISFGSLRHAAPQLFSVGADCDSRDVALPLNEILAKINPAMICPPQGQSARGAESERSIAPDPSAAASPEFETSQRSSSLSVPPISAPGEVADIPQTEPTAKPRAVTPKAPPIRVPTPQKAKYAKEPTGVAHSGASIDVDLASLSADWPAELRQEIAQWNLPEAKIALPVETVREGLKRGRVVFSWRTLRPWITPQPPATKSACDEATLELPLAVVAPLFLAGQKQSAKPATPDHAAGSFGGAASGQPSTREEIPDIFFDARYVQPSNGENGHDAAAPVVPSQASTAPSQVAPVGPRPDVADARNASGASFSPATSRAASAVQSVDQGVTDQGAGDQSVMRIPLKELTELWPENFRTEVAHWNLDQLMVALPAERINAALKQGKVVFAWENLRSWILPPPPSAAALQDKVILELPLPVIMPLFLAGRKQSSKAISRQLPPIADDIPDPFAEFLPGGKSASTESKETPVPATGKATPANPNSGVGQPATVAKSIGKLSSAPTPVEKTPSTDSISRQKAPAVSESHRREEAKATAIPATAQNAPAIQSPAEVLATALNLDGVVGALIALSDGFKVASKLPPGMDGDALAAFLPHIFSKVNQSARELRMGDLNTLNFTVDDVPWKIFRVNQIFFAALGNAGKPMPTDQLATLAHKLTFKN